MVEEHTEGSGESQAGMIRIDNFKPGDSHPYDTKYVEGPLQCEISTHWLGEENSGMNVAIYTPQYEGMRTMIACVYPGGRFEFSHVERYGE